MSYANITPLEKDWLTVKSFERATNKNNFNHWMRHGRISLEGKQKLDLIEHYKFQLFLKYHPDQPRVPAGNPNGGQFGSNAGTRFTPTQDKVEGGNGQNPPINLLAEEAKGGHTLSHHVGKSDNYLFDRVKKDTSRMGMFETQGAAKSSFPDQVTAEKFINKTLEDPQNSKKISDVVNGKTNYEKIETMFTETTGRQAYRNYADGNILLHYVHGALVVLAQDKSSERGYRIFTSYPIDNYSNRNAR